MMALLDSGFGKGSEYSNQQFMSVFASGIHMCLLVFYVPFSLCY